MTHPTRTAEALRSLLATGDEADRCYAARTLGVLGAGSAVDELAKCLRDDDIDVCVDAAEALGRIGEPAAVPHLLQSLENEPDGEVCTAVVSALGVFDHQDSLSALKRLIHQRPESLEWDGAWDNWWDIQLAAVKAVGRHADGGAVDALLAVLDEEDPEDIENEIFKALAELGDKGTEALFERLREGSVRSRRRAALALAPSAAVGVTQALGRALQDSEADVRVAAVQALAGRQADRYLKAIMLLLRDPEGQVRSAAAQAMVQMAAGAAPGDELEAQMLPLLRDPSPDVRRMALEILAETVEPDAVMPQTLALVLENFALPVDPVAEAAAIYLAKATAQDGVIEALKQTVADPERSVDVRCRAAVALGEAGTLTPDIMQVLSLAVADQKQTLRLAALNALMKLTQADAQLEQDQPAPLDVIIAAARGEIEIPEEPEAVTAEQVLDEEPPPPVSDAAVAAEQELRDEDPEILRQISLNRQSSDEAGEQELPLPEPLQVPAEEDDAREAKSTLEAIAMDNVAVTLQLDEESANDQTAQLADDPEVEELLALVDKDRERSERMFPKRKIDVELDVRRLGIRILGHSGTERAAIALIEALNDPDSEIRREAAEAIAQSADLNPQPAGLDNAFGVLVTLLAMEQAGQKIHYVRALGKLRNKGAMVPLLDSLDDESSDVRIEVIRALVTLVIEGLDPEKADHMMVRDISPRTIARKVSAALADDASGVRMEAGRALGRLLMLPEAVNFTSEAQDKIIDAGFLDAGQQARYLGQALRAIDIDMAEAKLLERLDEAPDSIHRRFVIEMLEELFKPAEAA